MNGNGSEKTESERIGAFWKHTSKKGKEYLRGQVNGERVVVFPVQKKWRQTSPDYEVFKSPTPTDKNEEKDAGQDKQKDQNKQNAANKEKKTPF